MYNERNLSQHYVFTLVWLLLGAVIGLHLPDIDTRLQWLIPPRVLLHRSILTHGLIISLLLCLLSRRWGSKMSSLRCFVIGLSLALAVHLCFDFFPRGWVGFALIHVPLYGRTSALFSQAWILLSIVTCLYLAVLMVRNVVELALSTGNLAASFIISAFENRSAILSALMLLALATAVAVMIARHAHKVAAPSGRG
jgi:hypothetical protein